MPDYVNPVGAAAQFMRLECRENGQLEKGTERVRELERERAWVVDVCARCYSPSTTASAGASQACWLYSPYSLTDSILDRARASSF